MCLHLPTISLDRPVACMSTKRHALWLPYDTKNKSSVCLAGWLKLVNFHSLCLLVGKHQALQPPCLQDDISDGKSVSASGSQDLQLMEMLHISWRTAGCVSVGLLALCCREARKLHSMYK